MRIFFSLMFSLELWRIYRTLRNASYSLLIIELPRYAESNLIKDVWSNWSLDMELMCNLARVNFMICWHRFRWQQQYRRRYPDEFLNKSNTRCLLFLFNWWITQVMPCGSIEAFASQGAGWISWMFMIAALLFNFFSWVWLRGCECYPTLLRNGYLFD